MNPRLPVIPPQPQGQFDDPRLALQSLPPLAQWRRVGDDTPLAIAATSFPIVDVRAAKSIIIIGRIQGAAGTVNFGPRLNRDANNNYGFFNLFSTGAGAQDGAAAVSSFIQAGQATNATSAAWGCFIPGSRTSGLTNVPAICWCGSSLIVLVRGSWWNQSGPVDTVQVVADASMAVGSYAAIYLVL